MNCEEARANLPLHVAGDIERDGAREALDAHLGACDSCRALAAEWGASHRLLQLHQPPEFGDAFFDSVRRDVMRQISEPRPSLLTRLLGRPFGPRALTYAAALSLLVCALVLSSHFLRRAPSPVVEVVKEEKGGMDKIQEPGSQVQESVKKNDEGITPQPQPKPSPQRGVRQARDGARPSFPGRKFVSPSPKPEEERAAGAQRVPGIVPPGAEPKPAGAPNLVETVASAEREMLRIELQTADPNVRIIWLSPRTTDNASSSKTNR